GGPFAWIAANARPNLVVGLLPVEPAGPPFGNLKYGVTASPIELKKLLGIPIGLTTSPASYHWPYDRNTVAFLRDAGCSITHIELEKLGITGNAHFMMMEKNNREVLQPILDF